MLLRFFPFPVQHPLQPLYKKHQKLGLLFLLSRTKMPLGAVRSVFVLVMFEPLSHSLAAVLLPRSRKEKWFLSLGWPSAHFTYTYWETGSERTRAPSRRMEPCTRDRHKLSFIETLRNNQIDTMPWKQRWFGKPCFTPCWQFSAKIYVSN